MSSEVRPVQLGSGGIIYRPPIDMQKLWLRSDKGILYICYANGKKTQFGTEKVGGLLATLEMKYQPIQLRGHSFIADNGKGWLADLRGLDVYGKPLFTLTGGWVEHPTPRFIEYIIPVHGQQGKIIQPWEEPYRRLVPIWSYKQVSLLTKDLGIELFNNIADSKYRICLYRGTVQHPRAIILPISTGKVANNIPNQEKN